MDTKISENKINISKLINNSNTNNEVTSKYLKAKSKKGFLKELFDLENILKIERIFDMILKFGMIAFIGYILYHQIFFINNIILDIGENKLNISDTTIQIFIAGTIVEFILGIKIIINSLFPESDRKNSLDFILGRKNNSVENEDEKKD